MKTNYPVKLIDDLDPSSVIFDLPQNINLFAAFLYDAIKTRESAEECLATLDKVKNGILNQSELYGDIYKLSITKPTVMVEDMEDPDMYNSSIRTQEFEELVEAWIDVIEKNV
jgi:hypothetical protein